MERKHLKPINASRRNPQRNRRGAPTASCDWAVFTYDRAIETPTLKTEAKPAAAKKQRKVA
jgi:hypothetical protein